jgi:hypothetical protein
MDEYGRARVSQITKETTEYGQHFIFDWRLCNVDYWSQFFGGWSQLNG